MAREVSPFFFKGVWGNFLLSSFVDEAIASKTLAIAAATGRSPPDSPVSHNIFAIMGGSRPVATGFTSDY